MKATAKNFKDVQKYFQGTTIVIPEVDPKKAFHLDYAGPDMLRVVDLNGDKGCIELGASYVYNIQSPLVTRRQWYQAGSRAVFISRIPARMWRKGISEENTTMREMHSTGWGNITVKLGTIQTFVEMRDVFPESLPTAPTLDSVALSPSWCLVPKTQTLFLLNCPVGKVSFDRTLVTLLKEFSKVKLPPSLTKWSTTYV